MCLFWWNTDIYLCGTSKTIASFSTANWINAPRGCWARSRAGNSIFCYAAALMVGSTLHSSTAPSPSLAILKPLLENLHIQPKKNACFFFFFFFLHNPPPLLSLRALILMIFCPSTNCWGDYCAPMQNTDPTWNSSQWLERYLPLGFSLRSSLLTERQTLLHSLVRPHTEQAIW